jgi:formamidopyrimidine-DNA glycosylase
MPELPDVEAYRRRLMDAGLDKRIEHVAVRKRRVLTVTPGTLRRHLKGKRLTETRRHGKWLLARIGKEEDWLAMHFGMTGALVPFEPAEEDLPKHTVLALELEPGPSVAVTSKRMLGKVTLTSDPGGFAAEHHRMESLRRDSWRDSKGAPAR